MARILIVEDEESINELIKWNLELVGHSCDSVFDGLSAITKIKQNIYDLVILDIMLPELDGFEVIGRIKETPVIFLTARTSMADKLKGLTLGGDDYISKPFEMSELIVRVNVILRRTMKQPSGNYFDIGDARVDFDRREVFLDGEAVDCTPQEFSLLEALIQNRNMALSRERLLELAWGFDYVGDTRTVDVHIQKIRRKFKLEKHIVTVYKLGYRLEVTS